MTDKEKIKEEIEKQIDYTEEDTRYTESYREGLIAAYQTIKALIDSLPEEHNEDLEEEITKCYKSRNDLMMTRNQFGELIHRFTEWQNNKDLEDSLKSDMTMPNKFYEKGRFDMREEMMKDAVEGTVKYEIGSAEIPQCDKRYQVLSDPTPIANAKLGDKVKIIIVKEEQL